MNLNRYALRPLYVAAILCAAGAAQATIVVTNSPSAPAFVAGSTDSFSDLQLNGVANPVGFGLFRSAGSLYYALSTTLNSFDVNAPSGLYVVPAAGSTGGVAVSTGWYTDSLTFTFQSTPVKAFGGNFFGTDDLGEFKGGSITVTVIDVNGLSLSQTISPSNVGTFTGFTSDVALRFASVSITTPNNAIWATVDNVVLSAVPEPSTWAMWLAGGLVALRLSARRRA